MTAYRHGTMPARLRRHLSPARALLGPLRGPGRPSSRYSARSRGAADSTRTGAPRHFAEARVTAGYAGSALLNMMLPVARARGSSSAARPPCLQRYLLAALLGDDLHYYWCAPHASPAATGRAAFHADFEFDFARDGDSLTELLKSLRHTAGPASARPPSMHAIAWSRGSQEDLRSVRRRVSIIDRGRVSGSMSAMYDLQLPEGSWRDWDVTSCSDGELRLAAGTDLSRDHGLELVFQECRIRRVPIVVPHTGLPAADRLRVRTWCGSPWAGRFRCWSRSTSPTPSGASLPCLIGAERVEVRQGTVFRYHRTDLKPGERLADWVRAA